MPRAKEFNLHLYLNSGEIEEFNGVRYVRSEGNFLVIFMMDQSQFFVNSDRVRDAHLELGSV